VCFKGRQFWPDSPVLDSRKTEEKWKKPFDLDLLLPGQPGWRRTAESLELTSETLAEYVINALLKEDSRI
jgi:hypothetical protein